MNRYVGSGSGHSASETSQTISSDVDEFLGYDYGTGTATGDTIDSGGFQYVGYLNGTGTATSTTIDSGGTQYVGDGGSGAATDTHISGGEQDVGYGSGNSGTATSTTIEDGGNQYVGVSGGTGSATDTTLSGGDQYVGSGSGGAGTATTTTIENSGYQVVGDDYGSGSASGTTIDSGGNQYVGFDYGTGRATGTTIETGGFQLVGYDDGIGTATTTTVDSAGFQYVGYESGTGYATGTTIDDDGVQYVGYASGASGAATSTTIESGGTQYLGVSAGGTGSATDTTISGGMQWVGYQGTGYASGTTIDGGSQFVGVLGAGTATSTTINDGVQLVEEEGTATYTTISGGGQFVGDDGLATNTTIDAFGAQYIGDDGIATSTTIDGGDQFVGFGDNYNVISGTATSTKIDDGGVQFVGYGEYATGTVTGTTIGLYGDQWVGVSGGTGYATSTTIESGGAQFVGIYGGLGTATDTTIYAGGSQFVAASGAAGTAIGTYLSGGEQVVSSGGTATYDIVYSGGVAVVLSGGVVESPEIDGGTLELAKDAGVGSGGIDFAAVSGAHGGTLDLTGEGLGSAFSFVISGFAGAGDTAALSDIIDVEGSGDAGDHLVWTQSGGSGTLEVETSGGGFLESLTLEGTFHQYQFILTETGGVDQIAYDSNSPCYCRGTRILTSTGEVAVEDLAIGDLVVAASGEHRPIKWIGNRAYGGRFLIGRTDILPIRFAPGSLGDGLPKRELSVSPEHAMFLDGVLIPARALIDGFGVTQARRIERVEYFHVELDTHDLLIAEGAASESFLDDDSRTMFSNAGEYFARYCDEKPRPGRFCAPRVESGWEVDLARKKIAARAGRETPESEAGALLGNFHVVADRVEGWARNAAFPDAPVCLDILADGRKIGLALANRAHAEADGHGFVFPLDGGGDPIEVRRSLDGAALRREAPILSRAAA